MKSATAWQVGWPRGRHCCSVDFIVHPLVFIAIHWEGQLPGAALLCIRLIEAALPRVWDLFLPVLNYLFLTSPMAANTIGWCS